MKSVLSAALLFYLLCFPAYIICQNDVCNCAEPFTVATFNPLQIFFAPNRDERLNATTEFFSQQAQQDIDVLCLQELWDPAQRQTLIDQLKEVYPYAYFAPRLNQTCAPGCTLAETAPLRQCLLANNCFGEGVNPFECLAETCNTQFEALDVRCQSCLQLIPSIDIEEQFDRCVSLTENITTNCEFWFDGWSDNLILSTTPLLGTDFLRFEESPLSSWTALYAQVNTDAFDTRANIFCTHLSARLPLIGTDQTNEAQVRELLRFVRSKVSDRTQPTFLMGDFNTGPGTISLDPLREGNFRILTNADWRSALLADNEPVCTFCGSSNPLAADTTDDWMIDHIFIQTGAEMCLVDAERIADSNNLVNLEGGETSPLSDHYGVKASFCESQTPFVADVGAAGTLSISTWMTLGAALLPLLTYA